MKAVKLTGTADEHHRGATDDDDANKWAAAVAQAWANDWSDPREDIYTLEDGKPLDR